MMEALRQFHFLQPVWLFGLLALPLCLWLGMRRDASQRELSKLVDEELLPYLVSGKDLRARTPAWLFSLGWLLCVLALAGPTWSRIAEPMYTDRAAQVVAISLSQHMQATDVSPSRMQRARYKARDLLAANRDGLNALIGYAGQSFVVAPLTSDAHSLDDLLNAMGPDTMPVEGDNAAQAIQQGVELIHHAKLDNGSIVLITDDVDKAAQVAAREALLSGVHVSVLGIGTPQGAPVPQGDTGFVHDEQGNMVVARRDDHELDSLAQAGGGRYTVMSEDSSDITALHTELHPSQHATLADGQHGDVWQDQGPWLLLPLLLIAAMAFRRGWMLLLLVLFPLWPIQAHASGWQDWWQRPDQQAATALQQGKAAKAQQLAQDPAWRGVAAYRANDYTAAVHALEQANGPDAAYNLGNALAKLGRYPEAIKAYDRALHLNPANDDARVNRNAVEEAMRKQQQQDSSSQQQQKSGNGQNNQSQQNGQSGQSSGQNQSDQNQSQQAGQSSQQQNSAQQNDQNQARQDQSGQQQNGQQQNNGAQDAQTRKPQQDDKSQQDMRDNASSDSSKNPAPPSSSEQAQTEKAQQALQQQMNQALAEARKPDDKKPPSHELGAVDGDDPLSKLPDDVRRNLERVPDDPGALLRRKFELEYRERIGVQPVDGDVE